MKVGDLIQRVQSMYSHGVQSDDSRLSSRHIYSKLVSARARLIEKELKSGRGFTAWSMQLLPCVSLIEAPVHECVCIPTPGCVVLRSMEPLPRLMSGRIDPYIESVTSLDGTIRYSATTWTEKQYRAHAKYTNRLPDYYLRNGYLYITWVDGPRIVAVSGLFEDPWEVATYRGACGEPNLCLDPLDIDFPMEPRLVDELLELAMQELVGRFSLTTQDERNNGRDDAATHNGGQQLQGV